MKDDANDFVTIKYFTKCLGGSISTETNKCNDLKVGEPIEFQVEITAVSCPEYPAERNQLVKIYPVGIDEALVLDVELLCNCDCEKPNDPNHEVNSPKCNKHGTFTCGICECNKDFYGRKCGCTLNDSFSGLTFEMACRPDNTTLVDCNGHGTCVCGVCECNTRSNSNDKFSGKYCECDNFSCQRQNGLICSGADHGTCECGECKCATDWSGPACACSTKTETCRADGESWLCSGLGECICGECRCKITEEGRHSGRLCDKCPIGLKYCSKCQMNGTTLSCFNVPSSEPYFQFNSKLL